MLKAESSFHCLRIFYKCYFDLTANDLGQLAFKIICGSQLQVLRLLLTDLMRYTYCWSRLWLNIFPSLGQSNVSYWRYYSHGSKANRDGKVDKCINHLMCHFMRTPITNNIFDLNIEVTWYPSWRHWKYQTRFVINTSYVFTIFVVPPTVASGYNLKWLESECSIHYEDVLPTADYTYLLAALINRYHAPCVMVCGQLNKTRSREGWRLHRMTN